MFTIPQNDNTLSKIRNTIRKKMLTHCLKGICTRLKIAFDKIIVNQKRRRFENKKGESNLAREMCTQCSIQ